MTKHGPTADVVIVDFNPHEREARDLIITSRSFSFTDTF